MRFEKACRLLPHAVSSLVLSAVLVNCSSSSDPNGPALAAGATGAGAGTGVSRAGSMENSDAGTSASAGIFATGGDPAGAGNGGAPATAGGSSGTAGAGGGPAGASGNAGAGGAGGAADNAGSGGSEMMTGGASGAGQVGGAPGSCAPINDFASWPSGKGPTEIGKAAVEVFKPHTGDSYGGAGYAWAFAYMGSLQLTKLTGDSASNSKLISDFERYASGRSAAPKNGAPPNATVDDRAFGDLPLEIFLENRDPRSEQLGLDRADVQWSVTTSDGITSDARYWADDMYMITGLQVYAYRASRDSKYLQRAAKAMIAYITVLQHPDGHFQHTRQSKAYWGRANGWVAAGMTELLLELPAGADRDRIMAAYKQQMDGLLAVQIASGTDAGSWRQVLDLPSANPESSCTAMFTFALVTGARNGWLTDPKYAAAARRGWLALGNKTSTSGILDQVCPGTGEAPAGSLAQQQKFYSDIKLHANDQHGQAPLMWTARALLRPDCSAVR
jgi:unsaturated rhamnogalacturonyl hydrolase